MIKNLVSIIIVNWNGMKWLQKCLDSLYSQTYKNFEIILVDNASTDESIEFVENNYPEIVTIRNKENLGFAEGNNIGLKKVNGDFVLLLNNDTWAEGDFLEKIIRAFDEIPYLGSVQPQIKIMDEPEKLDACGSYWTNSSILYHYGYGKNSESNKYNRRMPFFSNKGACMLIKTELIKKIGLFDDDFGCYYEETDFCHRVWLVGYECWYYPDAVIYHAMGGSSIKFDNSYIQFHNFKNKLLSFIKNFEIITLIKILPIYLILNIVFSFIWVFQGKFKHGIALYRAIWWNILNLRKTIEKRKIVQALRKKSDKEIFKVVQINPRLSYYYHLLIGIENYKD